MEINKFKCHFCSECNGNGCIGELPGMGGFNNNINFQANCSSWKKLYQALKEEINLADVMPNLRIGPMTGGIENVGYPDEKQFYFDLIKQAIDFHYNLSIGDGYPDEKLKFGIEAVSYYQKKAAVFIKPYPDNKILERIEWSKPIAEYIGIDIDSYNIITMRNLVKLEQKSVESLIKIKKSIQVPFIIKGVFTEEDIEIVKQVKPDVTFISNHGGRVENRIGSTAEFLQQNSKILSNYCDQIWVDGGIRTPIDALVAKHFGANTVLIGRPVITSTCSNYLR